ncbi:unnamed protein product [Ectocarpus sp. CCAP 1310/34]|nr:unnamed protein product [Ectocarpus sp. CCAP 1310/34]
MGPKLKKSKAFTGKIMEGRSSISSCFSKVIHFQSNRPFRHERVR